jgi:hypothetical protein
MFTDPDHVTLPESLMPKSTSGPRESIARAMSLVSDASATPNADRLPLGAAIFWTIALSLLGWAVILALVLDIE